MVVAHVPTEDLPYVMRYDLFVGPYPIGSARRTYICIIPVGESHRRTAGLGLVPPRPKRPARRRPLSAHHSCSLSSPSSLHVTLAEGSLLALQGKQNCSPRYRVKATCRFTRAPCTRKLGLPYLTSKYPCRGGRLI